MEGAIKARGVLLEELIDLKLLVPSEMSLNRQVIDSYKDQLSRGDVVAPPRVSPVDGVYYVNDGNHRVMARKELLEGRVLCRIQPLRIKTNVASFEVDDCRRMLKLGRLGFNGIQTQSPVPEENGQKEQTLMFKVVPSLSRHIGILLIVGCLSIAGCKSGRGDESLAKSANALPEEAAHATASTDVADSSTPESLLGKPASRTSYTYKGVKLGSGKAIVIRQLKELGSGTMVCNDLDRCTSSETSKAGVSQMSAAFKSEKLVSLDFDVDPSKVNAYISAATSLYGTPSIVNSEKGWTDWVSRTSEPCTLMRVSLYHDPSGSHDTGVVSFETLDATGHPGIAVDFCREALKP